MSKICQDSRPNLAEFLVYIFVIVICSLVLAPLVAVDGVSYDYKGVRELQPFREFARRVLQPETVQLSDARALQKFTDPKSVSEVHLLLNVLICMLHFFWLANVHTSPCPDPLHSMICFHRDFYFIFWLFFCT